MNKNAVNIKPTDKLVFDLEMMQIDYNEQKINSLKQEISDKYNVPLKNIVIDFKPISLNNNGERVALTSNIIDNIQKPEFQQNLIDEYLRINEIEDVDLKEIIDIDNLINSFVDFNSYSKCKNYRFKYVKWNNYLSYGKDNYFDFTKLNGLVLLNSEPENQSGKTTFAIDLLRFALFGKAHKSPTVDSVFNTFLPEETEVIVEACLEIDKIDYVIRRTITRPPLKKRTKKSKAKQQVEYFKLINGQYDLIETCQEETVQQTNNVIKETVGSVEDFNLVISATTKTLSNLVDLGQSDRGRLFSKWLGLVSLEDKEAITKDYYKTKIVPSLLSNKYNRATLEAEIENYNTVINSNENEIASIKEKKEQVIKNIDKYNKDKTDYLTKKKEIKDNCNIDVKTVENNISTQSNELSLKRNQFRQMKTEYFRLKDVSFDSETYDSKNNEILKLQHRNGELKGLISSQKEEINRIKKLIALQACPTCGHSINEEIQNELISKINDKIAKLIEEGITNKKEIENLNKDIKQLEKDKSDVDTLNTLKLKMSATKVSIENIKLILEKLKHQKEEYEVNKENIIYNNEIDNKINILDEQLKTEINIKENYIKNIEKLNNENINNQKDINKRQQIIDQLIKEEKIIRNWAVYQQLMGKNGIIKLVLKQALPVVNNEIKRLLSGLCDFDVILSISDDNKVCFDLCHDGHYLPIDRNASGYETCMASLALRCALGNIATIPRSNMLVLDEVLIGVGSLNRENIMSLYRRVLTNYDFIIHICHDTTLTDYHDSIITVTKKNNVSVIESK